MKRLALTAALALTLAASAAADIGRFEMRADGAVLGDFAECGRIGSESDVVESLGPGGVTFKFPGTLRFGDVVCARAIGPDRTVWDWRRQVETGDLASATRDLTLRYFEVSDTPVARWDLTNAWPSKILLEGATELVVLAVETIERQAGPATPSITWPAPDEIVYATPLGQAELDATSSAPGSFSYDPPAGSILPAGTHLLTATFTPTDPDAFTSASATVSLVVRKATLDVVADDATSIWFDPLPPFTFHFDGFVLDEGPEVVSGEPALSTSATPSSSPGTYPIVASAGTLAAANYEFAFHPGTLTIVGADALVEDAAAAVAPLLAGARNPGERQKVMRVRDHLDDALGAEWLPSGHLAEDGGKKFFEDLSKAAVLLETMLAPAGRDDDAIRGILSLLVKAARVAALGAIHAAEEAGFDADALAKARAELARGDVDAERERFHNAILRYRNAWMKVTSP